MYQELYTKNFANSIAVVTVISTIEMLYATLFKCMSNSPFGTYTSNLCLTHHLVLIHQTYV